ncbi:ABC transporter substrate-binding protein [Rheinheimera tilapiae]|uniref:ABC transporter substrate-binding protein n=1 Tax=Rheinheimera tilapiae TaxID=875043 RepID=A0ABV6BMV4_9GAMM
MRFRLVGFYVVALWSALLSWLADAQQPIKLGMSAPFSGPAAQLGLQFSDGANLVFDRLNAQGGINGTPIQLVTLDDGYEPLRTVENTRKFLLEQQVFALFGYIGTPTSSAILPLLRKHQRPYLAAFTGADILRQPDDKFIFNFRASYREEAATQARYFIDQRQFRRVALLIQADEFGASVERWYLAELARRQLQPVAIVRFQRNTTDMQNAVSQLKEAIPDVVFTVGTYQPLVKAIELGQQNQFNPVYSVVSFTGIQQLQQQLKQPYQVFASMVVPDPHDTTSEFVRAYRDALKAENKQASDIGLEGFAAASILVSAFKSCLGNMTQTCLMQQLPQQRLYDFSLHYQPDTHQASHQIFLYQLTPLKLLKI